MESYWIVVAALIVSLATLVLGGISVHKKADVDYVQSLETRLNIAEESLERCRQSETQLKKLCEDLERRNMILTRMIMEHTERESGQ